MNVDSEFIDHVCKLLNVGGTHEGNLDLCREIGADLAGTTEVSICEAFGRSGADCHLISPGSIATTSFKHTEVRKLSFPGLNTISGAKSVRKIISGEREFKFDAMLVDWRYVFLLRRELMKLKGPWFIIDRGPPAYAGPLSRLQEIYWKRAWKIAEEFAKGGLVVSDEHERFIVERLNIDMEIRKVPAGCHPNQHLRQKEDPVKRCSSLILEELTGGGYSKNNEFDRLIGRNGSPPYIYIAGEGDMHRKIMKKCLSEKT